MTGTTIAYITQTLSTILIGMIISFVFSWVVTLLFLGFAPIVFITSVLCTKALTKIAITEKKNLENASKFSNEAISNFRTIVILQKENFFFDKYSELIESGIR